MSKVYLPLGHAQRLAALLASLRGIASGELAARAQKAEEWLSGQIAEQATDKQCLRGQINSLRREWTEFPDFNATEEHWFRTWEESLSRLEPADWQIMREYLAYKPREKEKLWQVEKREWFLKSPQDTLQTARKWQKTHGKRATVHKLFTGNSQGERLEPKEVSEILSEIQKSL